MTPLATRLLRNAERHQRQGSIGHSLKLRILAAEVKTMREGPEVVHGPADLP
jgi:hypothetical protein